MTRQPPDLLCGLRGTPTDESGAAQRRPDLARDRRAAMEHPSARRAPVAARRPPRPHDAHRGCHRAGCRRGLPSAAGRPCVGLGVDGPRRSDRPAGHRASRSRSASARSAESVHRPGLDLDRSTILDVDLVECTCGARDDARARSCSTWLRRLRRRGGSGRGGRRRSRRHADPGDLDDAVSRLVRIKAVPAARLVVALADPGAESAPESRLRYVWVVEAGLPGPWSTRWSSTVRASSCGGPTCSTRSSRHGRRVRRRAPPRCSTSTRPTTCARRSSRRLNLARDPLDRASTSGRTVPPRPAPDHAARPGHGPGPDP